MTIPAHPMGSVMEIVKAEKRCNNKDCGVVLVRDGNWAECDAKHRINTCRSCKTASSVKYNRARKERRAGQRIFREFGITRDDYDRMLADQNNSCGICGKHISEEGQSFAIDHDHSYDMPNPDAVRGLLCRLCNLGMGGLGDDIETLRAAVRWLEQYEERKND